ncbi:phosphatase PAP2 family protein [Bradyrhizobium sp. AZCC 1614]
MVVFRHASDLSRPIGPPWLLDVVRDITALGSTAVLALLVTVVTTFLFAIGKRHAGLFVLTTVLSGAILNTLLKLAFARARPDLVAQLTQVSTLSFPSGHAAISAVCNLTLGLMLAQTQASRSVRIHLIMTAATLTLLVGVSRIYLGVHYMQCGHTCRSTSIFLISAMALAGLRSFGQTLAQFMMVWQR